ncbi:caspase domain-containing protein [Roridomyces roridus]|uniref:Caspase domain-containing protein n=1 Tax=Roridomyces roridus TaxID=1738132 RepID=A0AAD7FB95_9AGAR|nr:caspase domain-containing protein [Roridomyces roridus]
MSASHHGSSWGDDPRRPPAHETSGVHFSGEARALPTHHDNSHGHQSASHPTAPHNDFMPPAHPFFRRSKCTGRRRALCIGINYLGQSHALRGCITDAKHTFVFLVEHAGYRPEEIVVLTDDSPNPRGQPTRKNMIKAMKWLVRGAKPDDALFFHYSGHGGQARDREGYEESGYDDVIFPVDFEQAGQIVDNEMHNTMVSPLPAGCRLTSCHSGTVLGISFYNHHGYPKMHRVSARARRRDASPADVISIGGCKDDETSADTFLEGEAVGAASYVRLDSILFAVSKPPEMHPKQSFKDLIDNMREILAKKYSQHPQLGSSHPIDTRHRFLM